MLVFLEYIFQFFINNALTASNSVDRQNLFIYLSTSPRGLDYSQSKLHYEFQKKKDCFMGKKLIQCWLSWRWTRVRLSPLETFFSFFFLWFLLFFCFCFLFFVFFFGKTYFHFLTNLNYTGRIIAGSLSAFISKIQ